MSRKTRKASYTEALLLAAPNKPVTVTLPITMRPRDWFLAAVVASAERIPITQVISEALYCGEDYDIMERAGKLHIPEEALEAVHRRAR